MPEMNQINQKKQDNPSQRYLLRHRSFNPLRARIVHAKRRAGADRVAEERNGTYPGPDRRRPRNFTQGERKAASLRATDTIGGTANPLPCIQRSQQGVGVNLASQFVNQVIHEIERFTHVVRWRRRKQYKGTFYLRQPAREILANRRLAGA